MDAPISRMRFDAPKTEVIIAAPVLLAPCTERVATTAETSIEGVKTVGNESATRSTITAKGELATYIEERLHQHISTHNVATVAKALPWFNGITIKSFVTGRHESRSTSTCPSLPSTTYARAKRSTTRQSAPNWT